MGSDEAFSWRDVDRHLATLIDRQATSIARAQVAAALDSLGRQLTIAAGLTRAYRIGRVVIVDADWNRVEWHESLWTPGCGQEAP